MVLKGQGTGAQGHHYDIEIVGLLYVFGSVKNRHFIFVGHIEYNKYYLPHDKLPTGRGQGPVT